MTEIEKAKEKITFVAGVICGLQTHLGFEYGPLLRECAKALEEAQCNLSQGEDAIKYITSKF